MHLQHLILQLYATTSHCRSSHLPTGEHSGKKLISLLDWTIWAPCRTHTYMRIGAGLPTEPTPKWAQNAWQDAHLST